MPKPRVFISSTYYDLRHVRASLDQFVRSLGFETVLSEKGDIAYSHDRPLDESCYAEVRSSDMLVLVVGGRYGSLASDQGDPDIDGATLTRYDSITKKEFEAALEQDIPVFVLIEKGVYSEYQTYKLNKGNESVAWAHADSTNIFVMVDSILSQGRNNAMYPFDGFSDLSEWLRNQWAGLFRDLLKRVSQQGQLSALSVQVEEMRELNQTLKTYMEAVVSKIDTVGSEALINKEDERLSDMKTLRAAASRQLIRYLSRNVKASPTTIARRLREAKSYQQVLIMLSESGADDDLLREVANYINSPDEGFLDDVDEVRRMLDVAPLPRRRVKWQFDRSDDPTN